MEASAAAEKGKAVRLMPSEIVRTLSFRSAP